MSLSRKILQKIRGTTPFNTSCLGSIGKNSVVTDPLSVLKPEYIHVGADTLVRAHARLDCWDSYEGEKLFPNLTIGDNVNIGFYFSAHCTDTLFIGNNVLISSFVLLTTQNHGMNPESDRSYQRQPLISKPIRICDGVWIGEKVSVMPGVTIGEKSIIGANSVVTRDVPPYCIAAGNPARVIKTYDFELHEWVRV